MRKTRLEKEADREFAKLSKKERRRINGLGRIPVAPPGSVMGKKKPPRKKKWDETEE